MKISGDCLALNPQPLPLLVKNKEPKPKDELALNKWKLAEIKEQMKLMRGRIKKFSEILEKEVGDDIDMKYLLRYGSSHGWQGRSQMIATLRLKLIAMRSKFLDPPHKMYYRGPFDPKKEFDLKFLPQKQDNLYQRMLEEKKENVLLVDKPVAVIRKELDELSLMHRAARFRTKNLTSRVESTGRELEKSKERAEFEHRVVEAMMAHQSLFKMMVEPETFRLDPSLKRHAKLNPLEPPEVSEWLKLKMLFDKSKKEKLQLQERIGEIARNLDQMNRMLIEGRRIETENRLRLEGLKVAAEGTATSHPKANKNQKEKGGKSQSDSENEYELLIRENRFLSQFLLATLLSTEEDFRLFTDSLDTAKQEFIDVLKNEEIEKNTEQF